MLQDISTHFAFFTETVSDDLNFASYINTHPFLRCVVFKVCSAQRHPKHFGEEILLASWFIDSLLAADSLIKNLQCILCTPLLNITFSL